MNCVDERLSLESAVTRPLAKSFPNKSTPTIGDAPPGYELFNLIGRGGMGLVYRARHVGLDRTVALKIVRTDQQFDEEQHRRFRLEAEAVAALQHPGIVQVFDVGEWKSTPYLAMEWVPGGTLSQRLDGGPLQPNEAAAIVEQLARAIHHSHGCGIIHRDLKPSNILLCSIAGTVDLHLSRSGRPSTNRPAADVPMAKIVDFGIAKRFTEDGTTKTGQMLGTPSYMAPEQITQDEQGPATDVYSLGAILYECLTGRPPFHGATALETLDQVAHDDPVQPRQLQPKVPADLNTICLKCLAKSPRQRYESAEALAQDLASWADGEPILARPIGVCERAWKFVRRRPAAAGMLAVSAAAMVALTIGGIYHSISMRAALNSEKAARAEAAKMAEQARARFDLALDSQKQLIRHVKSLSNEPGTRAVRQRILDGAIKGLDRIASSYDTSEPNVERVNAIVMLGTLYGDAGNVKACLQQAHDAVKIATELAERAPDDVHVAAAESNALHALSQALVLHNDIDAAANLNDRLYTTTERMLKLAGDDVKLRRIYVRGVAQVVHLHNWKREIELARPRVERLHQLTREWAASNPDNREIKLGLLVALDRVAAYYRAKDDERAAIAVTEQALLISRQCLKQSPDDRYTIRTVMVHAGNLSEDSLANGDTTAARAYATEALAMVRLNVAAEPEMVPYQKDLAMTLATLGNALLRDNQPNEAFKHYREALDVSDKLLASGKAGSNGHFTEEFVPSLRVRVKQLGPSLPR